MRVHDEASLRTLQTEAVHEWEEKRRLEQHDLEMMADAHLCIIRKQAYREKILSIPREYMIFYDAKTTGLDPNANQIIQFSACDGRGTVLIDTYIHPTDVIWKNLTSETKFFDEKTAETFRMLEKSPSLDEALDDIQTLFDQVNLCAGYGNFFFDDSFLEKSGILFDERHLHIDLKKEFDYFSRFRATKRGFFRNFKTSHTLEAAASYFSYNWEGNPGCPHSTLENAFATLYVFDCLLSEPTEEKIQDDVLDMLNVFKRLLSESTNEKKQNALLKVIHTWSETYMDGRYKDDLLEQLRSLKKDASRRLI